MTIINLLPLPVLRLRTTRSHDVREIPASGNLELLTMPDGAIIEVYEDVIIMPAPTFGWNHEGVKALLAALPTPIKDGDTVVVTMPAGQLVQAAVAAGGSTNDFFGAKVRVCSHMTGPGQCTRDASGAITEVRGLLRYV
jgi:hypothetical protein